MHILLIEDDGPLGEALLVAMRRWSYTVTWLRDGREALAYVSASESFQSHVDLVLLDLGLPQSDGLTVLAHLRQMGSQVPVLIVTARDALESRVAGLDAGADDYLVKPFHLTELAARMRSLQRRTGSRSQRLLEVGKLRLNLDGTHVECDGRLIELTRSERLILILLMERAGRVVARDRIEAAVYGGDRSMASNALEVQVHGLRRKLGASLIQTVRGLGYMLLQEAP